MDGAAARADRPDALARRAATRWQRATLDRATTALAARTLADPDAGPLLRALQSSTLTRPCERLPGTLNDIRQFETLPPLPIDRIIAPILVIHGTADRVVPFAHATRVADAAPQRRTDGDRRRRTRQPVHPSRGGARARAGVSGEVSSGVIDGTGLTMLRRAASLFTSPLRGEVGCAAAGRGEPRVREFGEAPSPAAQKRGDLSPVGRGEEGAADR